MKKRYCVTLKFTANDDSKVVSDLKNAIANKIFQKEMTSSNSKSDSITKVTATIEEIKL